MRGMRLLAFCAVVAFAQEPPTIRPRPVKRTEPDYPEEARRAGANGTVHLRFAVSVSGYPENIEVERSAGFGMDEEAVETLRRWRFEPATKGGVAVRFQTKIEINLTQLNSRHGGQFARLHFDLPAGGKRPILIRGKIPTNPNEPGNAKVRIAIELARDGTPRDVSLIEGVPAKWAEDAVQQVREWRFSPARVNGAAIETKGILEVTRTANPRSK